MSRVRNTKSDPRWAHPKDGKHNAWIDYWNDYTTKLIPEICPCCGGKMVDNGGPVGGHVRKVSDPHGDVFVTPICSTCNKSFKESKTYEKEFDVDDEMLVYANYLKLKESDDFVDPALLEISGLTIKDIKEKK